DTDMKSGDDGGKDDKISTGHYATIYAVLEMIGQTGYAGTTHPVISAQLGLSPASVHLWLLHLRVRSLIVGHTDRMKRRVWLVKFGPTSLSLSESMVPHEAERWEQT